ncbi:asparagine synthase (glutamine-hydrolyzing) [Mucilaginibacter panaciglaebae]|uniref:asparagine synthase (glutamine-hydrolyzing) n=1 Tax=Mucilaginibacter panaciglaebae TaxID=502331 RepID=A0ABP7WE18_9SPHI
MCGIYGSTIQYNDCAVIEKLKRLRFRGPDYSDYIANQDVILGHNRLSIIDLDQRSNQPMQYEHLTIVFNGEIYNYKQLRQTLSKKGYDFRTNSDTEVICAAYLDYGEQCVQHFNGMFAFVIYDNKRRMLFGARDRLGKKPFYYIEGPRGIEFASQPSAIAMFNDLTIDDQAVNAFLRYSYIPEPLCIYKEIKKLQAGTCFNYHIDSKQLKTSKYWNIDFEWKNKFTGTYAEALEQTRILLSDAIDIRLNADVPIGIFLSSGVDSSLITALASARHANIKTFNVRFSELGYDESQYSKKIATHLGTHHHIINCTYADAFKVIENYHHYFDEPFADVSAIPGLLLAQHVKKYVTVALSGDGGDENFLGYNRYHWMKVLAYAYHFPLFARKNASRLIKLSSNYRHQLIAMGLMQADIPALYQMLNGGLDHSFLNPTTKDFVDANEGILYNSYKPLMERLSDYDLKTYLNEDINTKVDRCSMAYAVESRAPLLDYRVVELARSLPTEYKMQGRNQKRILKDILFQYLPSELFNRPKQGFSVPLASWFRAELKDMVLDTLNNEALKNIAGLNVPVANKMISQHMKGVWNRSQLIWSLLVITQWQQKQAEQLAA